MKTFEITVVKYITFHIEAGTEREALESIWEYETPYFEGWGDVADSYEIEGV